MDDEVEQPKDPKNLVYEELRRFYNDRYKVFDDEFKRIELITGNPPFAGLTVTGNGVEVELFSIPDDLSKKMDECITQQDFDYITEVILRKIREQEKRDSL
ncbi:MAG TPA: hypothetical protein VNS32_26660 [Flavisolibacter sp.]|nr:hypothetical protein [Flavisolibacter sp.]